MCIRDSTYAVRYASKFYPPEAGWIMLYNEDILNANGITGIEDKVRAGEWTWDYFLECAKACTKAVSYTHLDVYKRQVRRYGEILRSSTVTKNTPHPLVCRVYRNTRLPAFPRFCADQ